MTLATELIEALQDAKRTTGKEYNHLVPVAMTLQHAGIDSLPHLRDVIRKAETAHDCVCTPPSMMDQALRRLVDWL